ncbi:MAG: DNA mismatch repair protein MutS [Bacteroidia bacterium]|nr:MAG: DNA mismatch repair protein MutS [Bacteroidia bacterium]PIE86219.1 MAG: DNA mismatch repair protein MutS [Bacteroidia bacterium]
MAKKIAPTPLMKQYNAIKTKHPDAILLFRVGDFYETFSEDAIKASGILGITLTRRANGSASYIELAGFPFHALDTYLPKLVRAGQRVAICEQLEDPQQTKKIVKRGVTELITPGITVNDNVLERKENNYLACLDFDSKYAGIAFLDLSTGEFLIAEGSHEYIDKLVNSFAPKEILYGRSDASHYNELFANKFYSYKLDDWMFNYESGLDKLKKQFNSNSLKGFGVQNLKHGIVSAGAILHYLELTHNNKIAHINKISRIEQDAYVWLDKFTVRNLELIHALYPEGKALIDIIDKTQTPMGGRMLKRWISLPLKNIAAIKKRYDIVEFFTLEETFKNNIENIINQIGDLERLASKIASQRISPREIINLKISLQAIFELKTQCEQSPEENLKTLAEQLAPCVSIRQRIEKELNNDPPAQINKMNVIASGVSDELDEYRKIAYSGKDFLIELQQSESERTGISSLKIGYNNVYGYYFEVRNTHKDKVPPEWTRRQTLVSSERYINEKLKELEAKIIGAEEKMLELEIKLYQNLVESITEYIPAIQLNASLVARLDCLMNFATIAIENKYVRPEINDSETIEIKNGRHPVIEKQLPIDEEYIPNDVLLDTQKQQIIIITGPNMAGKSALLRQTALIVLLAQIGSFVPAEKAKIGYVDKIFTRVGASDNISLGESTFMVEMNEAAAILNNISQRSLILFDELGRGTSTYDGISIAWAIVEYLHENPKVRAKTMFATHYHELNEMEKSYKRIKNYNVSVKEIDNKIIFLRKLVKGGSEHSFGIHVAKLAGMPKSVVERANKILKDLETNSKERELQKNVDVLAQNREGYQLSFYQLDDPVLSQVREEIKNLDINSLTPLDALNKLNEIKKITGA